MLIRKTFHCMKLVENIFTNKKTRSVCLSVCLSGYTFRHAFLFYILDIDRGHIFWEA